ncbi:MAG: 16S rRNA (guanine(966)-N(2))-methyltransferase RsmD [Lactovum sp.]
MRIIAGKYGGRPLKSLSGVTTRPTSDKIKGAIFNMLSGFLEEKNILDLYAGSASLSIEAVSRGAKKAILVERDRAAQKIILENIQQTKETDRFYLFKGNSEIALKKLQETFDLVFLDPPYAKEQILSDIKKLIERRLLSKDVKVVVETEKSVDLPEKIQDLEIWKQKIYGITKITIYKQIEEN